MLSQGFDASNKRRAHVIDIYDDDSPNSQSSPPESKRAKHDRHDSGPDSAEDEVNVKGSWRCLFYEDDPDTHFHCKEKRYKRVSELRRHIKTHTLPHYCAKCGYRTAEERRLINHKCEPNNMRRYSPVTEEDRLKHEQLARMGIKVGEMRRILFGKKGDTAEESMAEDDETESSEADISRRPSLSITPQQQQDAVFIASDLSTFQPAVIPAQTSPTLQPISVPQPSLGAVFSDASTVVLQPPSPPYVPNSVAHSPPQGEAAWYYHGHRQEETGDFVLYAQPGSTYCTPSPVLAPAHVGPFISPYPHPIAYTSSQQDPVIPVTRTDSLDNFSWQNVFPDFPADDNNNNTTNNNNEIANGNLDRERRIPESEIRAMEEYQAAQERKKKGIAGGSGNPGTATDFWKRLRNKLKESTEKHLNERSTPTLNNRQSAVATDTDTLPTNVTITPTITTTTGTKDVEPTSSSPTMANTSVNGEKCSKRSSALFRKLKRRKSEPTLQRLCPVSEPVGTVATAPTSPVSPLSPVSPVVPIISRLEGAGANAGGENGTGVMKGFRKIFSIGVGKGRPAACVEENRGNVDG